MMIAPVDHNRNKSVSANRGAIHEEWNYELPEPAGNRAMGAVRNAIGQHPVVAVASAAIVGLAAAWFVKRRGH